MSAANYDITIEQGSKFTLSITYYDTDGNLVDLTGYEARMQIRECVEASDALLSITHENGISLGGAGGTIDIAISAVDTANLNFTLKTPSGYLQQGVYDLELVPGGIANDAFRLIEGKVTLSKEVTR